MNSKKIIVLTHCVLNQNSVVKGWSRAKGAFPIVNTLVNSGIGIIQLKCPELQYKGLNRPPMSYDDYNVVEYRQICQQIVEPVVLELKNYINDGYLFVGVIGINNSPSCSITNIRGVLMEEFFFACEKNSINVPFFEIPEEYNENQPLLLNDELDNFLLNNTRANSNL